MSDVLRQLRKSRQRTIELAGFKFTYRRPTDAEAARVHQNKASHLDMAREFVCGWEGVRECDIYKQGTNDTVPFDQALWVEWVDDKPDWWIPLGKAIMGAYNEHANKREEVAKN